MTSLDVNSSLSTKLYFKPSFLATGHPNSPTLEWGDVKNAYLTDMFLGHDDKIGDDLAGVARQLPTDQTAESTGCEYSGFWITIPGKHFHLVLAVALNPGWGSFTVRALSCP